MRLHLNRDGYRGERIDVPKVLDRISREAEQRGWTVGELLKSQEHPVLQLVKPSSDSSRQPLRIYLSTGIHGDEPAGPLAALQLIKDNPWPANAEVSLFPCLNPVGLATNQREGPEGLDLNRDYRSPRTDVVQAHREWLQNQSDFDVTLLLHEDWEADGFYLYNLSREPQTKLAEQVIRKVSEVCPILQAETADGWPAEKGIVRPEVDPETRPDWPEALYLFQEKTNLSFTFEAPSDYDLPTRVSALVAAVNAVIGQIQGEQTGESNHAG